MDDLESPPESEEGVEGSPPGPADEAPRSLEDAIRDVLPGKKAGPEDDEDYTPPEIEEPPESSPGGVVGDEPPEGSEPLAGDLDEDAEFWSQMEDRGVPLGKIERFREVIAERNRLRESQAQLTTVQQQLDEIRVAAESAGMDQEALTELFSIPMLMSRDPKAAYEAIERIRSAAAIRSGQVIPDDLRAKVDDGYMDEESAREMSIARAELEAAQRRANEAEQARVQEQNKLHMSRIVGTVNEYQARLKETDPDYDHKHKFVSKELADLVRKEGRPATPEAAVAMAKRAYETVNRDLGFLKPARRPTGRQLASNGNRRTVAAKPASLFEAVANAVNFNAED